MEKMIKVPEPSAHDKTRIRKQGGWHFKNECFICQREMKKGEGYYIHVVDGGDKLWPIKGESYQDESADLGLHQIGNSCAKKIPTEYREKIEVMLKRWEQEEKDE